MPSYQIGSENYSSNNKSKSENDKLKLALARSTIDNKRLEEEIQKLKLTNNFLIRPLADFYQNEENNRNKLKINTEDSLNTKTGQLIESERKNELSSSEVKPENFQENTFKNNNLNKNLQKYINDFAKNEEIKHDLKEITIKLEKTLSEITELKRGLDIIIERL